MTSRSPIFSRRNVLAAVGSVGFLAAGARVGRAALSLERVDFNQYQQIDGGGPMPDVLLNWRETYNGAVLEESDFSTPPTAGPSGLLVDLNDVLPGDSGTLTLQVELGEGETADSPDTARILLTPEIYENSDNGINEPERKAGDTPGSGGDLDEALGFGLRYDEGCDGADIPIISGDTRVHPDVAKSASAGQSVRSVTNVLADGVELQPPSGDCFAVGESTCLTLEWTLPEGVGNVVQTDSLGVLLRFTPRSCEA